MGELVEIRFSFLATKNLEISFNQIIVSELVPMNLRKC
jgi:hypothetical protein